MSNVKLKHSSGNGTKLHAPAANPSADITLKVPSTTGSAGQVLAVASANHSSTNAELEWAAAGGTGRKILEQFFCPCDGSVIATANGNITITDQDAIQSLTTSYADVVGSSIAYTPPTGTTQVIYEYQFAHGRVDDTPTAHIKLFIDSDEVTDARTTYSLHYGNGVFCMKWAINIGGSAVTATGRQASWGSAKTIKLQAREYSSGSEAALNKSFVWEGAASDTFHRPSLGITAIG